MKQRILISLVVLLAFFLNTLTALAQDCDTYFITDEGSLRVIKSYDKKDKLTGTIKQRVIDLQDIPGGKSITVEVESYDKKDELNFADKLTMTCKEGVFKVDMKNYLNYDMMAGLEGIDVEVQATDLEMPSDIQPGMELKDGNINVRASNMGITIINMEVRIYDRKVEAKEKITTPAGTFDCYRLTYTTEVKTMGKLISKSVEWVALDIGSVRSESYDKNNKLTGYTVLTEVKQ